MNLNPFHIWASMGPLSKLIAAVLLAMAATTIAIAVERWLSLARGSRATRTFMKTALPILERGRFEDLADLAPAHGQSPFARLIGPTLRKLTSKRGTVDAVELVRRESERQKEAVSGELRRGLSVLASIGSVAPFVGLLGTVVGIISAFQGIAATGSGGLGAVSAGIAEALVETALGLLVAIPSVLLFNQLNASITTLEGTLARATGELIDDLENRRVEGSLEAAE
ncbi:MAG TPA: MotA/TolQ/ExbB proton channel family protein [Polyangiaceae bacterium]|nr:MotA/TolQ/ExbB proton channel family protein [Polyangiaceae bacterium]